ncbi:MAG: metallophosphoesterase family protein [Acidimicrobiales bacterium]
MTRIFYATDLHGSEVCWRKLVNAGAFYRADVVICGGDMTGKAMVPVVDRGTHHEVTLQDHRYELRGHDDLRHMERKIVNRGYYPVRVTPEEMEALANDPALVEQRFKQEILRTVERWMDIAQEKLAGTAVRCICCPGNDDMFDVDKVIHRSAVVEMAEGRVLDINGFALLSTGWTNPTPWNTYRETPEEKLRVRIDRMVAKAGDPKRAIFSFHAPPYGSSLDEAPALDQDLKPLLGGRALQPVGSTAVRDSILEHQPVLSLHGHIHESRGARHLGKTLAVNPGSAYEEGVLQAAVLDLDPKKFKIRTYQLVTG